MARTLKSSGTRTDNTFRASVERGVLTVQPSGPKLGEREATIMVADVHAAMSKAGQQLRAVVLDLSHVQLITSYGLGLCIEVRNTAKRSGAQTVLYGLSHELVDLFRMMKLDSLFTLARTPRDLEAAVSR